MKKIIFAVMCVLALGSCTSQKVEQTPEPDFGEWKAERYVDAFGDETDEYYFTLEGKGLYTDKYNENAELKVQLVIFPEDKMVTFQMFEKGVIKVSGESVLRMVYTNPEGETSESAINTVDGVPMDSKGSFVVGLKEYNDCQQWWWENLMKGGILKTQITCLEDGLKEKTYAWKVDVSGFKEIYESKYNQN